MYRHVRYRVCTCPKMYNLLGFRVNCPNGFKYGKGLSRHTKITKVVGEYTICLLLLSLIRLLKVTDKSYILIKNINKTQTINNTLIKLWIHTLETNCQR